MSEQKIEKKTFTAGDLKDCKMTAGGGIRQTQPCTEPNVRAAMDFMGMTAQFDVMSNRPVLTVKGERIEPWQTGFMIEELCDVLLRADVGNISRVGDMVRKIASQHRFHPMEEWLMNALPTWDGDPIGTLAACVDTPSALWPIYLRKWLIQVVSAVCSWRKPTDALKGAPFVLVMAGDQGVGKGRFWRAVGGPWIKTEAELHLASTASKDHQLSVLSRPMAELSELDGTFRKADIASMKSFLTRTEDEIRAPYARVAEPRARMTAFAASVNHIEFLV